ncbi:MAG TPA: TraR/DksA C4-type zinc finger protein [Ktedonobacterales bacterium]|nr:TraR/DksA C4-type zinc finger protein [Ktedonobacterales bacterium]
MMEARNRYTWQEGSDDLEPGNRPAERVVPIGRKRAATAQRGKAAQARPVRQSKPVDAVVGPARPAPVREGSAVAVAPAIETPPGLAERLREQHAELQARLARLEGEAMEFDEDSRPKYSNHPADEAAALHDRTGRDAVARVLVDDMQQVERALERLAAGSYGLCDDCGQPIPPKRLEARPTATLCVSCQSQRELRASRGRVMH